MSDYDPLAEAARARTLSIVVRLHEIAELRRQASTLPNTNRGRSMLRIEAACIEDLAEQVRREFVKD